MQKRNLSKIYWLAFLIVLLLFAFVQYFGLVYYHYPVPPGHDAMMHWWIMKPIFEGKTTFTQIWEQGGYPPGFHYFISSFAHLFHTDPINIMLWFCPSILVLAGLAIFWFTYKIFNPNIALTSLLVYAFLTKTPLQQLNDGGYPNLIAAQVLLPIFLLFFCNLVLAKSWKNKSVSAALAILALVLIGLTHHISFFYVMGLIIIFLPVYIIYLAFSKKISFPTMYLSLIGMLILYCLTFYAYKNLEIFMPFRNLSNSMIQLTSSFPFYKIVGTQDPESLVSLTHYPSYLGVFLSVYAFLGLLTAIFLFKKQEDKYRVGFIVITVLAAMLFIGSRLNFLSNPDRLIRDLAVPLSIFAGIFLNQIAAFSKSVPLPQKRQGRNVKLFVPIAILIVLTAIPFKIRLKNALAYEPMVRFTSADQSAVDYFKSQPPGKILIEGYDFYFERFLPGWQITYLWLPQTAQPTDIHPLNPNIPNELMRLKDFDYIYIVNSQKGWTPSAIKFDFAKNYLNSNDFNLVMEQKSPINDIYLFKVKH